MNLRAISASILKARILAQVSSGLWGGYLPADSTPPRIPIPLPASKSEWTVT